MFRLRCTGRGCVRCCSFLDELLVCMCCKCSCRIGSFRSAVPERIAYTEERACSVPCLWQDGEKPFLSCLPLLPSQMWNTSCTLPFRTCRFDVLMQHFLLRMHQCKNGEETEHCPAFLGLEKKIFRVLCWYNLTLFDSFFLPFGATGMEGKLDWTKDLVQFARILEAWIEISNRQLKLKPVQVSYVPSWSEQFTCWIKKILHLKPVFL